MGTRGHGMEHSARMALAARNAVEVITREELGELLRTEQHPRVYAGYEPSGKIHLGHVLTINKLIDLKNAGFEVIVLLADLHAYLNEKGSLDEVRQMADMNRACFEALGLEDATYKYGSDYQLEREYVLDVLKLARNTTLARARRSMDEVSRSAKNPQVSQMIYPLMQAVDIARLGVDVAVGGIDQRKIHMLAREGLVKLGYRAPVCIHTPILLGLDGEKMSSSKGNYISVDDTEEQVNAKLKKAFCPEGVVENNPVLEVFRYHIFPRFSSVLIERPEKFGGDVEFESFEALEQAFAERSLHPADLKGAAASYVNEILEPVRERLEEYV
ncbi:MAG: tyrosyl-tRNA synthetase [Methanosarcinales archaeon]|nr:MAG: Tyrosine--tRNA ligase [Euryarchaeota archaeon 55_53]MDI3487790.1 tyrosyl-tRNA synthetase [Methanosarcinales archaeon]MDN5294853.1 tyrosyl-tRNA synthetase [Methanosarcinales archaeon]